MGVLAKPIPFGDYFLLEKLNTGGMAEVFKAKTFGAEGFERIVAVKKILPSIAEDKEFISMFVNEAKLAVQLTHANIAQINDLGCINGDYYIAMEYVPGHDLRVIFDRCVRLDKKLDIGCVCYIISKVCEGLDYAHNKRNANGEPMNIIHRDISPQNIMIGYDGEVKLIDFGIAKATNQSNATQVGILKGKFSYMSPEQVSGKTNIDRRSDIFALGIVLFEMLTLKRLFLGASDFETLEKIRKVEVSPPTLYNSAIPDELEDIVMKALEKDVANRFQSAQELQEALQRFMFHRNIYYTANNLSQFTHEMFAQEIALEQKKTEFYKELTRDVLMQSQKSDQEDETSFYEKSSVPKTTGAAYDAVSAQSAPKQAIYAELDDFEPPKGDDIVYSAKNNNGNAVSPEKKSDPHSAKPEKQPDSISMLIAAPIPAGAAPKPRKSMIAQPAATPSVAPSPEKKGHETIMTSSVRKRDSRSTFIPIAIVLVLIIIGLVIWGILNPKDPHDGKIQFVVTPNDLTVSIEIDAQPGQDVLTNGPIEVDSLSTTKETQFRLSAEGYEADSRKIQAKKEGDVVYVDLKPLNTASATILVEQSSADVWIDGQKLSGDRRFELQNMAANEHTLVVEKDGYKKFEQKFTVKPGEKRDLRVELKPEFATLVLKTEPFAAKYSIRNRRTGAIQSGIANPQGVTIEDLPADDTFDVTIVDGEEKLQVEWKPNIREANQKEIRIFSTKHDMNAAAVAPIEPAAVAPQPARVARPAEPRQMAAKPEAKPQKTAQKSETAPKKKADTPAAAPAESNIPGLLMVNSKPPANIYINGKDYGSTPKKIELPAGNYIIRFVNSGAGINTEKSVSVKAGDTVKLMRND